MLSIFEKVCVYKLLQCIFPYWFCIITWVIGLSISFFNGLCITQYLKRNRMLQSAQKKTTCRGSSGSNKHRKCFIAWKYVLSLQIRRVTIVVRFWCLVLIILNPETLSQISYQTYLTLNPKQITLHHFPHLWSYDSQIAKVFH